jgi:hypothetical protein
MHRINQSLIVRMANNEGGAGRRNRSLFDEESLHHQMLKHWEGKWVTNKNKRVTSTKFIDKDHSE